MTTLQRNVLIVTGLCAAGVIVAAVFFARSAVPEGALLPSRPLPVVSLGGQSVSVSVADTDATRQQGLSGRAGLGDHEGKLFVFPSDGYYAFWMKDMRFSIDMVWLSARGTVVFIKANVSPDTFPQAFRPNSPARYVVELPAGFVSQYNIKNGDSAVLPQL
jgi:uncharacterized membrane protein (UPF0127 family)